MSVTLFSTYMYIYVYKDNYRYKTLILQADQTPNIFMQEKYTGVSATDKLCICIISFNYTIKKC